MDIASIIPIVIIIVAIYILVKFIFSPILKILTGVIILFAVIYILQHFFNIDIQKALGPLAPYFNIEKWVADFFAIAKNGLGYIEKIISSIDLFSGASKTK